jgi:hypothetical protein
MIAARVVYIMTQNTISSKIFGIYCILSTRILIFFYLSLKLTWYYIMYFTCYVT